MTAPKPCPDCCPCCQKADELERQLAALPALVEALEELVRSVDEYCHRGLEKRHGHLLDCDAARAALALVKGVGDAKG